MQPLLLTFIMKQALKILITIRAILIFSVARIFYLKKYIKFKKMYVILLIEKKYYPKSTVLRYERVQ